jgi:diadenylate cyclase
MIPAFITIRFFDILDILFVGLLLYQGYRLIKGTVAYNIVIGLFIIYLIWLLVRALNMELLGSIIGQFIGVGVLALIIVFHPEIRKFLVFLGTNYRVNRVFHMDRLFPPDKVKLIDDDQINEIAEACISMSRSKTGALIVIARESELIEQVYSGERINSGISAALIKTIFFKNSPLHDGAIIIKGDKILSAGCILPLTQNMLDKTYGLRHRAALGITETTDAISIVVSEEKGAISIAMNGTIKRGISKDELIAFLGENLVHD